MQFPFELKDPLKILTSTKPIVENLKYITIQEDKIQAVTEAISKQLQKRFAFEKTTAGNIKNLQDAVQITFLQDVANFCFWAEKDKPKWKLEWPEGAITSGGEFSLRKVFHRALEEKIPILDAKYLSTLTFEEMQHIFRGASGVEIPLIKERWQNLQETGTVLLQKYQGEFINAIKDAKYDAIEIVTLLYRNFSSFRDISEWNGEKIYFLKRAQLCVKDIASLEKQYNDMHITRTSLLTAFADYKLPQMLRKYGITFYTDALAEKVDNYILIPAGSREEIEIRASTIWCIELLRQKLKKYEATDIAYALWLLSQDQTGVKPYHRTYTIYY